MKSIKNFLLCLLCFFLQVSAQIIGDNDTTFNPLDLGFNNGVGAKNVVLTSSTQSDGKKMAINESTLKTSAIIKSVFLNLPLFMGVKLRIK